MADPPPSGIHDAPAALEQACHAIEEAYEFMLAYAAQGLATDGGIESASQVRVFLARCDEALSCLADLLKGLVARERLTPSERYDAFIDVLDRDAQMARAAVRLVLAQGAISSQLIDNLNASIHLRALLTDLFLIDEIVKTHHSTRLDGSTLSR